MTSRAFWKSLSANMDCLTLAAAASAEPVAEEAAVPAAEAPAEGKP